MLSRPVRLIVAAAGGAVVALGTVLGASAHEHRVVGGGAFTMRVGWSGEPTFTGVRNAVQLFLSDLSGTPITDLGNSLVIRVAYQGQTGDPLALQPAFGATYGTQGEYDAPLMPTRPGDYTFHFTGSIHGVPIDESFTSSPTTFDPVRDDSTIEFPVRDPSRGDLSTAVQRLAGRVDQLPARIDSARTSAQDAGDAATRATVVGVIGVVLVTLLAAGLLAERLVMWRRAVPPAGGVFATFGANGRAPVSDEAAEPAERPVDGRGSSTPTGSPPGVRG